MLNNINTTIATPETDKFILDDAEVFFENGEFQNLCDFCKEDESQTQWLEEGIRNIRFDASYEEPLCAPEYAKQMRVSSGAVEDTQVNAGLDLVTSIGKKPVGDSAVRSICDRGLIGAGCYELLRKNNRGSLKTVLNLVLAERKGAVQVKYSHQKIRAVHSARYSAIGNDKLLDIMNQYLKKNWPDSEFQAGYVSHYLMRVVVDFSAYTNQFFSKLPTELRTGYSPAIIMTSSDVAVSAVNLVPAMNMGNGVFVPMAKEISIAHIGADIEGKVRNAFDALLAYFDEASADIAKLKNIVIRNGKAALVRLLKSGGMPKAEAAEALDGFSAVYGDTTVTALEIYLAVSDGYAAVVRNHTQDAKKIFAASDCVARAARARWSDIDLPGEVTI